MSSVSLSILIVYMNGPRLVRQTLRNLRRIAPRESFEIIVIDNNVKAGFVQILKKEFPEVRYIPMERNVGFGAAMNKGIHAARGELVLVFNPDLAPAAGSLDCMVKKMRSDDSIGILAPQLLNPDGSLQYSIFAYHTLLIPALSRTFLGKTSWGRKRLAVFQLRDRDHDIEQEVDWAMGSALLAWRKDLLALKGFDEQFFMYYEDADLCRRMHMMGKRVVYFPEARMVHYHRRASADGSLFRQLLNPLTWQHIRSAVLYAKKYRHHGARTEESS
ncbi:glycosyltransferase family 2 protein [bacterium]|nr:glycosyltransferase family 2 protein [bacterium]